MQPSFSKRFFAILILSLAVGSASAEELIVSAAASLTNAFKALGPVFEAQHPGTKVLFNFAASDALVQQIAKGAPVDVFASADQEAMDKAQTQQLLASGTRKNFVGNSLVLIVPADSKLTIATIADLTQTAVTRIAIGNPASVPVGRYTKQALEQNKLWSAMEPKAILAQSVRQGLDYVARGEVDAGFVYNSDATILKTKVRVVATVPTEKAILYPIAAIASSQHSEMARQFVDFTLSTDGQALLAQFGFLKP